MKQELLCPRLYPIRILSRKWSYPVLRTLRTQRSFSVLSSELQFITNRILSRELKLLQQEGLVLHSDDYALTPSGRRFLDAVEPLGQWSVSQGCATVCDGDCSNCERYRQMMRS